MTATEIAIEARDVRHVHAGGRSAIDCVTFRVRRGEVVAIVGPSGCGKTTLLDILAGRLSPTTGEVAVAGLPVLMPQRDSLLPWKTVLHNATIGAQIRGVARSTAQDRARQMIGRFGLDGFEGAWPHELSGGMRQRLALLRTFLTPGSVLLLDEPLGALDPITRHRLQQWLEHRWLADRRTLVLVTHDVEEALLLSDRVIVLSDRPARVCGEVASHYPRPRSLDLAATPDFVRRRVRVLAWLRGAG